MSTSSGVSASFSDVNGSLANEAQRLEDRDSLIVDHLDLARKIAAHYIKRLPPDADPVLIYEIAENTLIFSAQKYRAELGVPFKAYIVENISGDIIDHMRVNAPIQRNLRAFMREVEDALKATNRDSLPDYLGQRKTSLPPTRKNIEKALDVIDHGLLKDFSVDDPNVYIYQSAGFVFTHTPEAILSAKDKSDFVRAAISKAALRKEDRIVIVMHYLKEISVKEIARILRVDSSRVSQRLARGMKSLREYMTSAEKDGIAVCVEANKFDPELHRQELRKKILRASFIENLKTERISARYNVNSAEVLNIRTQFVTIAAAAGVDVSSPDKIKAYAFATLGALSGDGRKRANRAAPTQDKLLNSPVIQ